MKSIVTLTTVLLSSSVFAAPLLSVQSAVVSPAIKLVTWTAGRPSGFQLTAFSTDSSCSLDYSKKGTAPAMKIVGQEPKQDGYVYSFAPVSAVDLKVTSAKTETSTHKGYCNGEPELCDNTDYNQSVETLTLTDAGANEYTLRCYGESVVAPATPAALDSAAVKIPGLSLF